MAERRRRFIVSICIALAVCAGTVYSGFVQPRIEDTQKIAAQQTPKSSQTTSLTSEQSVLAATALQTLPIKGRAPKTGYSRDQFGAGWDTINGCSVRQIILRRDLQNVMLAADGCSVDSGTLNDIYTDKTIAFTRGASTSDDVQIDHIVALSDAWQKGAQHSTRQQREALANDPLNLLAVDGPTNQAKSDADAATWLPPNKAYRCRYVARQIAVKAKYSLWVTQAEHDAIQKILANCPQQVLPVVENIIQN